MRRNDDTRRAVVSYGDASIRGTYRDNTLVPVKQIQRAIAKRAIVITVDEFRTSAICSHCHRRMNNVLVELVTWRHDKIKHRVNGVENKARRKCLDEEGQILTWAVNAPKEYLCVRTT